MRTFGEYELDDDRTRLDLDGVWKFLSTEAYWGRWRTREQVDAAIDGSWRVVGAYPGGGQVGFARAFSHGRTSAHLADVFVVDSPRGSGLGEENVREGRDNWARGRLRRVAAHRRS